MTDQKLFCDAYFDLKETKNGSLSGQKEWQLVCSVPVHGLEGSAPAEIEAGVLHKKGGPELGTAVPDEETGRCGHDI